MSVDVSADVVPRPSLSPVSAAPAVDVNSAFAAERRQQLEDARTAQASLDDRIAAGTLVPVGGDRYRINDPGSWDNGEIVARQGERLIAQHGLDMSTGQAALYSAVPAWHGLGSIVPGGISDIDRVLELGRIDFRVEKRTMFYPRTAPLDVPAASDDDSEGADATAAQGDSAAVAGGPTMGIVPDKYVTVRADTEAALGTVGERYEILQNRDLFEFLQSLVDDDLVAWESAGALRGGRRVFVSVRLPESLRIDAAGINDEIVPFVVAINSHDGSSLATVVVTPWRPVCGNTERFAVRDAYTRWGIRHTRNARDRLDEARRALGLTSTYYAKFRAEEEALAHTQLEIDAFLAVLDDLWPVPDESTSQRTRTSHAKRRETLTGLYVSNSAQLGRTGYAAERAITEYTDWHRSIRPSTAFENDLRAARATAALEGSADELKERAHHRLLALTTR